MRVKPLTSILSHKGRGCLSPERDDTLSLEVRELFKHPLKGGFSKLSPDDRQYTQEHEWIKVENAERGQTLVGITDYAQDQLGDVVYLDLPQAGSSVRQQDKMGEVESVKAVSDLFSPVSGQVMEVNTDLLDHPERVNEDPFGQGWLIRVTMSSAGELDGLMSATEYESYISGL